MADPITIVGGGIAGLTCALCLARTGQSAHVLERSTSFDEVGAGLQLSPNALSVLFALGLKDALKPVAVAPARIALHDGHSGARLNHVELGSTAARRYGYPYWVLHRADLQKVLVAACESEPQITLSLGVDMDPEASAREEGAPLIAADGVWSRFRKTLQPTAQAQFMGTIAWRATMPAQPHSPPETRVWFGRNAHLVDYPISAGAQRNLVAIERRAAGAETPKPDPATLRRAFSRWHPTIRDLIGGIDDWTPWPLAAADPRGAWSNDDTVLIGDAAHAMLPFAAQGAATAIEDAWVLAQALASKGRGAEAFRAYETARKPRVQRVWREALRNGHIYHMAPPLSLGRNAVIRASRPHQLLSRYDWLYSWKAEQNA